jgi:pimeloyl-ACP methyl ester carboxylesterase
MDPFQKPEYAQRLADAIPNAKLEWITDAAHWIMEEKPREVATCIVRFLDDQANAARA